MCACITGHKDVVKLILDYAEGKGNIDFNKRDIFGKNAFMLACHFGQKEVVQLLLDLPDGTIDFNAKDIYGNTALILACYSGKVDVVKLVLDNLDKNVGIRFPNFLACSSKHLNIFQLILEHAKAKGLEVPNSTYMRCICDSEAIIDLFENYHKNNA